MFQPLIRLQAYWVKIVYRVQALPRPQRPGPAGGAPPGATKQGLVLECSNTMEIWWNMNKPTLGLKQNGHRNPPQKKQFIHWQWRIKNTGTNQGAFIQRPQNGGVGVPQFLSYIHFDSRIWTVHESEEFQRQNFPYNIQLYPTPLQYGFRLLPIFMN